jgi:hypothetical protein
MVKVVLKGTRKNKTSGYKEGFIIGTLNAGIVLREKGGVFLVISDQELSEELRITMNKYFTKKNKDKRNEEA